MRDLFFLGMDVGVMEEVLSTFILGLLAMRLGFSGWRMRYRGNLSEIMGYVSRIGFDEKQLGRQVGLPVMVAGLGCMFAAIAVWFFSDKWVFALVALGLMICWGWAFREIQRGTTEKKEQ